MSYQKVMIVGNLGADPEMTELKGGKKMCKFSVAVSNKDNADWFRIVAFDATAEACAKFLKKGQSAFIDGRLSVRQYKTKEGEEKTSVEVIANSVQFMSPKANGKTAVKPAPITDDELPF